MAESRRVKEIFKEVANWRLLIPLVLAALAVFVSDRLGDGFWATLVKEAGFALFVAVFIWVFFEVYSRKRQEEQIESRIELITKNVFFGVFRRELPQQLIDETSLLILEQQLVRQAFHVTYELTDCSYREEDGTEVPFVSVQAQVDFKVVNVSSDQVTVPVKLVLPNPMLEPMRTFLKVEKFTVIDDNGTSLLKVDIKAENAKLQEQIKDDNIVTAEFTPGSYTLPRGGSAKVNAIYTMPKELEDSEVLQTLIPADGLRLTIIDFNPSARKIRARAIHRRQMLNNSEGSDARTHYYTLDNYLLPHQGVVWWWKSRAKRQSRQPPILSAGPGSPT